MIASGNATEFYEFAKKYPDSAFGALFLEYWNAEMKKALEGRTVSREFFWALHEIVCAEAAHMAMERIR
jgi:hypothetical protein